MPVPLSQHRLNLDKRRLTRIKELHVGRLKLDRRPLRLKETQRFLPKLIQIRGKGGRILSRIPIRDLVAGPSGFIAAIRFDLDSRVALGVEILAVGSNRNEPLRPETDQEARV